MRGRGEGTLQQRGPDKWRLRVYTGQDPTGRPHQISRTVTARNRTEALKELRKLANEVDQGRHAPRQTITVGHLLREWMANNQQDMAVLTRESYTRVINNHLAPGLGRHEISKVTALHLDRYYQTKTAAGLKPRSIRIHHAILSAAFEAAIRWGWIERNPARLAKPPKLDRVARFTPEVDEVRQLIAAAGDDEDLKTSIMLMAITGCRRGELCGLAWADVDRLRLRLKFERQRIPAAGGDITTPLKHGEGRLVSLGQLGLSVIDHYRRVTEDRAAQLGVEPEWAGWLISPDCGRTPLSPRSLDGQIRALGRKCGVPVTAHAFRRFAATFMVGSGVDVRTAANRLGHSTNVLLDAYAQFLPERDSAAAIELERKVLGDD